MKRTLVLLAVIITIGCNQQSGSNKKISEIVKDTISSYPKVIDSLNRQGLYDTAKWALYCIYSDDTCMVKKQFDIAVNKTFGTLDLKFNELRQQNDTIEIDFYFYLNDTLRYDITTMENHKRLASGVGYKRGSDSILFYTSQTTMKYFWEEGVGSRYENPLQPEVVAYIKSNKEKINPWFRKEAERRKIIN